MAGMGWWQRVEDRGPRSREEFLFGRSLSWRPDFVLPERRLIVFVDGCWVHGHESCAEGLRKWKKERAAVARKRQRDMKVRAELVRQGWQVWSIWGCEVHDLSVVSAS